VYLLHLALHLELVEHHLSPVVQRELLVRVVDDQTLLESAPLQQLVGGVRPTLFLFLSQQGNHVVLSLLLE
jgi:hypothetical protein